MQLREICQLIEGTEDAAFVVDATGAIVAWNDAATHLFGLTASQALGQPCHEIIQGMDECREVCSLTCPVRQAIQSKHALRNFDMLVPTALGEKWCNVSVIIVPVTNGAPPHSIHILREIDTRKRLESLLHDFVLTRAGVPAEAVKAMLSAQPSVARQTPLSQRELEVLRLLAKGLKSAAIAKQLQLKPATVNNHIQHILQKLDAHSRLEAIRRAEKAGLI